MAYNNDDGSGLATSQYRGKDPRTVREALAQGYEVIGEFGSALGVGCLVAPMQAAAEVRADFDADEIEDDARLSDYLRRHGACIVDDSE